MTNQIVQAASPPALAKNARTGHPRFGNGKKEHGRLGHPSTNGECVTYDAMGRIVETSYNSVYTEIWYTQLGKSAYMHGSTPYYAYWPTPGNGTAEVNGNAVTFYYMHKDWLGNSRISSVIVNPAVVSDQAYAPYGEVYNKLATGAGVPAQMFTGDTQDIIGGIFDTPNRELNASQGRWISPDPAGAGWNLYAYVTNNPNSNTDPLGLGCGYGGSYVSGGCEEYVNTGEFETPDWSCWGCDVPIWIDIGGPPGPGPITGQHIFSGQDCLSCYPLGPDPLQILQDVLSGNLWGAFGGTPPTNCLPICDYTTLPNGSVVGDFPGEQLCSPGWPCIYWNPNAQMWGEYDVYPPMAQGVFQKNARMFQAANGAMIDLTAAYAALPVVVALPEASLTAAATAETYGIPVFATSLWIQQNWNTLLRLYKFGNWAYQQCQTNGPC